MEGAALLARWVTRQKERSASRREPASLHFLNTSFACPHVGFDMKTAQQLYLMSTISPIPGTLDLSTSRRLATHASTSPTYVLTHWVHHRVRPSRLSEETSDQVKSLGRGVGELQLLACA